MTPDGKTMSVEETIAALRERADKAERERDEARAEFAAWAGHRFKDDLETTKVIAERDALKAEVEELRLKNANLKSHLDRIMRKAAAAALKDGLYEKGNESALAAGEGEVDRKALIDMAQETMDALDDTVGEEDK